MNERFKLQQYQLKLNIKKVRYAIPSFLENIWDSAYQNTQGVHPDMTLRLFNNFTLLSFYSGVAL